MGDRRSLRECLMESVDDLDNIAKQILDSLLNRDKHQRGGESLNSLVQLFDSKQEEVRGLLDRVNEFRERQHLIKNLEKCVDNRNTIIQGLEANLKTAESILMSSVFQANNKVRSVRSSEMRPVNSEEIIKMSHQISKDYSVAAPLTWQQGDPSRPFPTEPELRNSQMATPRQAPSTMASAMSINMLRQSNMAVRTPPLGIGRGGASPMMSSSQASAIQRGWSPRTSNVYQGAQASSSPRGGRGGSAAWTTRGVSSGGGASPFQKQRNQNSPRMASPTVSFMNPTPRATIAPISNVEQMSSDSSSSSSSEDEGPRS